MKCTIPEISWHNKDPVLSIDIQPSAGDEFYRLASGGTDSHILIWHLQEQVSGIPTLECVSDLTRHQKAVNVVRFSPSGNLLASGDDESVIIVWKRKTDQDAVEFPDDLEVKNQEQWVVFKILRGHLEDIYDLSWSADENNIVSGSVDNTAIIWDVKKGRMKDILRDHKSFVQGVAWDPAGQLFATLSSDRICRIYNVSNRKLVSKIGKALLPGSKPDAKPVHLFHDDTLKSFFRRLCFSPCGSLLIAPAGVIEPQEPGQKAVNTTLVFSKNSLSRPVAYLPSNDQYSVAVRCCPKLFALRDSKEPPLFNLPYRVVFAIATQSSVILYDTQHNCPFAFITNIHYTRLTDLAWSRDGKILIVSSTDGYCSIITFCDNELGEPYVPNKDLETNTKNKEKKAQELTKSKFNSKMELNESHDSTIEKSHNPSNRNKSSTKKGNRKSDKSEKELKGSSAHCSSLINVKDESGVDDTSDYCLVLEDTVNDSVNARIETSVSEKSDPDKTEKELENKNEKRDCPINSSFSEVTESSQKLFKEKKESLKQVVASVDPSLKALPVVSENENLNDTIENNFKTPSKDCSTSLKLSSPITSADPSKTCTPPPNITPIEQRKPKRAQLITLSSPKSKKKL